MSSIISTETSMYVRRIQSLNDSKKKKFKNPNNQTKPKTIRRNSPTQFNEIMNLIKNC